MCWGRKGYRMWVSCFSYTFLDFWGQTDKFSKSTKTNFSKESISVKLNMKLCLFDLKKSNDIKLLMYFSCLVVWNPWDKKSKAMTDLGDDEYKQMLCVDGAAIEKPITLKPGEEWTGRLEITVVPSSFCSEDLWFSVEVPPHKDMIKSFISGFFFSYMQMQVDFRCCFI